MFNLVLFSAFIVEFEYPSYTVMEGESVEVCLVNTTNPERVHNFIVQFYTSYDCDISSTVTVVDDATGIITIIIMHNVSGFLFFHTADLDYEALYSESDVVFPPDTNRACTIINTYHDNLQEGVEQFIVRSVHSSGVGQTSDSTDILIVNVNGKLTVHLVRKCDIINHLYTCSGSSDSID